MRNYGHEAETAAWERDYDKVMNDVMGLSELVGKRNGELNDLNALISNALVHLDAFPGGGGEDIQVWLLMLKDILNGTSTL